MPYKLIAVVFLFFLSFNSHAELVKKSKSGICHDRHSMHYDRTTNFKPFNSLEECFASGGRLPAHYKKSEAKKSSYSRNAFQHWIDEDKNCLNTRHELLKELSTGPITMDERGCRVIRGRWNDPYTNKIFYDGDKVDVDHLIPLKWAWENGADQWDADKRKQFANDPRNLFVVSASANRSKGAKGPHEWLPPYEKFHCQYLTRYLRVLMIYKFPVEVRDDIRALKEKTCAR